MVVLSLDSMILMMVSYNVVKIWNFRLGVCFWIVEFGYGLCGVVVFGN